MAGMIFKKKTTYQTKCDYCHKACHEFYRANIGDFTYNMCSMMHVEAAQNNYKEKISKGLTPNNFNPITEEDTGEDNAENYV